MATEEKIVYSVEVEGADKAASDFQRVVDELDRLTAVHDKALAAGKPGLFKAELAKSIEWLPDAVKKYARELEKLDKVYGPVVYKMNEHAEAAKKLAKETEKATKETAKTTKETDKVGGAFGRGHNQLIKFAGAMGFGVYSMYSLASALRRGFRAIVDFVKKGVELAIEKHAEWKAVMDKTEKGLRNIQTELGEKLLPAIGAVNIAQRELMETMGDEESLDRAAAGIGGLAIAWAGVLGAIEGVLRKGKQALADAEGWAQKHPGWAKYGRVVARIGAGAATFGMSEVAGAYAGKFMDIGEAKKAKAEAEAAAYVDPLAEEYGRYRSGEPGPYSAAMYKRYGIEMPGKGKKGKGGRAAKPLPGFSYMAAKARAELIEYEAGIGIGGPMKGLREEPGVTGEGALEEAYVEVAESAKAKGAQAKMFAEVFTSAAQSGSFGQALKQQAISMAAAFATGMVGAGVASSIMKGLGKTDAGTGFWDLLKGFVPFLQETGQIPGGGGASLAVVHAGEYVLDEARVQALRAGYGVKGGKGEYNYTIQPASPNVEVHLHPGVDAEVQTALRARAGEAKLAGMEA